MVLETAGHSVSHQAWDSDAVITADLVLPILSWGYHLEAPAFCAAMNAMHNTSVNIKNPADIIIWNHDKRYLRDLSQSGFETISTLFVPNPKAEDIALARRDFGTDTLIVKPIISAGAKDTIILGPKCLEALDSNGAPVLGHMMLQPFMQNVLTEGEWSLIFLGGAFSHCVLKIPKQDDFRSQPDYGAHLTLQTPPIEARDLAEGVIDFIGRDKLLYARVDMVRHENDFKLMEVELIEPDLYLNYDINAKTLFLNAIETSLL
jgi:glutathione synthase/RimK-type ligase-like ATP-grasp enzyme